MPIGTCFHPRTAALCESQSWRDWAGFFAASTYEVHHEREYNAIRQAAALFDISPLFKYRVTGPDATRLVDRVVTRNVAKMKVGQVAYTHWCDGQGKIIDDGTVSRLGENVYRWTAADPSLRWILMNSHGLDAAVEDISEKVGALALQGPTSRAVLQACLEGTDIAALKYFRVTSGAIRGIPVDVSRTGYTGDLGYEVWVDSARAVELWDALLDAGRPYDVTPAGMLALDVARIEAGLILLDVDYVSARRAVIPSQKFTPFEIGLGRLVDLEKEAPFIGQQALRRDAARTPARELVGLDADWDDIERLYGAVGLPPAIPATASRVSVPVYKGGRQVGRATSSTWSPTLKRFIALASLSSSVSAIGTKLQMEFTVEHQRQTVGVTVARLPFFDPPRKRQ